MIRSPRTITPNADAQAERERVKRQRMLNARMGRPDAIIEPVVPLDSLDRALLADHPPRPVRSYNLSEAGRASLRASIARRFPKPSVHAQLLLDYMRPGRSQCLPKPSAHAQLLLDHMRPSRRQTHPLRLPPTYYLPPTRLAAHVSRDAFLSLRGAVRLRD